MLAASLHPVLHIPPLPNKKYLLATNYHIYPSTQEHDIQPFLSAKKMETFIHAFITSLLEYCNTLSRLQFVQNLLPVKILVAKKDQHIYPIPKSLNCCPITLIE